MLAGGEGERGWVKSAFCGSAGGFTAMASRRVDPWGAAGMRPAVHVARRE